MTPGHQPDASGRLVCLLAKGEYFFGCLDDRLEKHLHRNCACGIQCPGNFPGMGGNLFEGFRPVKLLAAGDKPNFQSFQIDHKCAFYFPDIWKVVNEWGGGGQTNSGATPVNPPIRGPAASGLRVPVLRVGRPVFANVV
jgi:hypothetical protein